VERHDGYAVVSCGAGRLGVVARLVAAAEAFLSEGTGRVGALGADLARRLVLAGLAVRG
jgi:hypothetical protein